MGAMTVRKPGWVLVGQGGRGLVAESDIDEDIPGEGRSLCTEGL